jgi:AbiV family abortive infection protein
MTISNEMMRALAGNAVRHLTDADLHLKRGNIPSAMSSAVFAIEELGKLCYISAMNDLPPPHLRRHHPTNTLIYVALLHVVHSLPRNSEWSQILREGHKADVPLTESQKQTIAKYPEFAQFMDRLKSGGLEDPTERVRAFSAAAAARAAQEREFAPWMPLIKRGLQDFRLAATYVDQRGSPGNWNDPQTVDPDVTRTLCVSGLLFLVLVFALAEAARPGLAVRDLETFPADFTGIDVLSNLLERLQSSAPQLAAELRPTASSDT